MSDLLLSSSPGGSVVAAGLAARGHEVTLLRVGGAPDPAPEVPVDLGLLSVTAEDPLANEVFGPLVPFTPTRAVVVDGALRTLPLDPLAIQRLFPATRTPQAASALVQARARMALAALIGGGREQRSYRDWVVQRFGEPVFQRLFSAYAEKRFGPPESLVCGVARTHHGPVAPCALVAPAEGWGGVARRVAARVPTRDVAEVHALRADGVDTDTGRFTGTPWVDLPPATVLPLLAGRDPSPVAHHVARMEFRHGVEAILRGGEQLPFETHVLDAALPFFRVVRVGLLPGALHTDRLSVQFAVEPGAAWAAEDASFVAAAVEGLERVGVRVDRGSALVRRLPAFHPVWSTGHLVRLRHWVLFLEEAGVNPFGRSGLASLTDLGTDLRWLEGRTGEEPVELRELARQLIEPPVRDPVERPHLRSFIVA